MPYITMKYSLFLIGVLTINTVYGNDLIRFGQSCLVEESHLNQIQQALEKTEQRNRFLFSQSIEERSALRLYKQQQQDLARSVEECSTYSPNSVYCHQVRHQYNELSSQLQEKIDNLEERMIDNSVTTQLNRANFEKRQKTFLALCRDSDTHYAFIQDIEAYGTVCLKGQNKHTITCTLF